ncbi:MAG: hypothetical protein OEY01_03915 [Desulfobulbaceae bacterium]|nr:hypothetical protein [Desulfobulbaceae bacterium]HIJ78331.1 hypothetical protein [Deltaproteobacteria bacterium]
MAFLDFFKGKKNKQEVKVTEHKHSTVQNAAVAAAFAEAGEHETARSMITTPAGKRSLLVIGREDSFSSILTDYAVNMAKRMNAEMISLNFSEEPLAQADSEQTAAVENFRINSEANVATLKTKAEQAGIAFSHLVEIGDEKSVLKKMHAKFPQVRYVLTEPDVEAVQEAKGLVTVPVCDMATFVSA